MISLCVFLVLGCSKGDSPQPQSAGRDAAKEERPLLIGLIPEQNIFNQVERYEPLMGYLSEKIVRRIRITILPGYGNIIDNFASSGMDGAFFGSFAYVLAHTKLGLEPVARPEDTEGISTYHGMIFVRKDSGIHSVMDMRGKCFAFVDRATTAGYLLPRAYFKKYGIGDYMKFLKEVYYTGTHVDAIYDVLNRRADIGSAKNTIYQRLAEKDPRISEELLILTRSPDVPENGLAVRKDLDESLKKKLKEALLTMHEDPNGKEILNKFGTKRFIETNDSDYHAVYAFAQEINLNLASHSLLAE